MVFLQAELLVQTEYVGVGDVHAIQKREQIQDAQEGNDMEIDPGDDFALARMRRTLDLEPGIVVGVGSVVIVGWIPAVLKRCVLGRCFFVKAEHDEALFNRYYYFLISVQRQRGPNPSGYVVDDSEEDEEDVKEI